jgi:urease accessory protein
VAIRTPEAQIAVRARRRGGRTVVTELGGTEPWQPRVLGSAEQLARVALVQTTASLLGGDDVSLLIDVGDGAALELVELGATIAHHARAGPAARVSVRVRLGRDARLVWLAEPLIAAAGCSVDRATRVELASGARVLLRDAVVLGRVGEEPGRVSAHTRITLSGRAVVDETLDTSASWLLRSSVVAGGAGMLDGLTLAGVHDGDPPPGTFDADQPATLWRRAGGAQAAPGAVWPELASRWRGLVLADG